MRLVSKDMIDSFLKIKVLGEVTRLEHYMLHAPEPSEDWIKNWRDSEANKARNQASYRMRDESECFADFKFEFAHLMAKKILESI